MQAGEGGAGKTRLLIEVCDRLEASHGWRAGFVDRSQAPSIELPALLKEGKTPAQAQEYLKTLFQHVVSQDSSARNALQTFLSGRGDVLLDYESEAINDQKKGSAIEYVIPDATILIQNPLAAVGAEGTKAAKAFVNYLVSPPAQQKWAEAGYRPVISGVPGAEKFPTPKALFTIESLGIMGMKVNGNGPNGRPLRKDEEGFPLLGVSGYIGMGDDFAASNLDNSRTYQFVDNVSFLKGKHALKVGGDIRKLLDDATTNNTPFGSLSFDGSLSGDPAADYVLGLPRTVLTPEGVPMTAARQWRIAFYGQDDWKVTPKLTLNLGLRYDLFNPPKDINHSIYTLDFITNPKAPTFIPVTDPIWSISHRDFSPRLGFAYSVTPRMVVRGGYGIFYFGGQFDHINILQLNPPTAGSVTITNQLGVGSLVTIENPMPPSANPLTPINAVTLASDGKHPDTYVQNWNLQVSRQFGNHDVLEVGYVGSKGTHVDTSFRYNWNQPDPGPGDIQSRRPYPTLSRIRMQSYGSNTLYHSLQARFEHRLSKQLSLTTAYTYSHLIDDSANTTNDGGCQCQNPRNVKAERASSLFDQRHLLVVGYVWNISFAERWKGPAGALASGWSFQGIVTMASGNPFDIRESSDTQNNDGIYERPLLVPGQKIGVANQGPNNWFNVNAFAPSILVYGNSPRNPVVGPGRHTFDLSLGKTLRMPYSENHSLQFRAEFFNAFNTPQFATPDQFLGDGAFGQIQSTALPNRELQFGLKYKF